MVHDAVGTICGGAGNTAVAAVVEPIAPANILFEAGWNVTAVEPSEAMQAIGRQKLPAVRWITAVAEHLPFQDEAFACVLFFATLEFVDNPQQAIKEALRVLQPGGHLIIGFLEVESSWVAVYRHHADLGELPWRVARFYDQQQLETMVRRPAQEKRSALWLAPYAHPTNANCGNGSGVSAGTTGFPGDQSGNRGSSIISPYR